MIYGAKYQRDLDIVEIAKRMRADIRAAVASGDLPKAKYSVTCERYSMGRSIDINATALPFEVYAREYIQHRIGRAEHPGFFLSEQARIVTAKLKAIHDAYNFDGNDLQTDYHNMNFNGGVEVYNAGEFERMEAEERATA